MSKEINSKLHEYSVSGNIEAVNKCINDGITNIYSRTPKKETPLYFATKNGHAEVANILWDIYENDLKFIERSLGLNDKFWMSGPILIGFGNENIALFEKLYSEYQNCESDKAYAIDKTKCVVFLLKSDNFMCKKVLCASPTTVNGRKLTLAMVKCVISNGFLDLNSIVSEQEVSLLQAAAESGLINLFQKLLEFGAELNEMLIICDAIQFGHIDILETLNKTAPFRMYNILISCEYNWCIYENDNWQMFKYVIERCIDETHLTFNEIIHLPVSYDPYTDLTVFQIAVVRNCYKIGEKCLAYGPKSNEKHKGTSFGDCLLQFSKILRMEEAQNLILQLIELDPSLLEYVYDPDEKYRLDSSRQSIEYEPVAFLHEFVLTATIETIQTIYKKYPFVGLFFFKDCELGIYYLYDMLERNQNDKIKLVLANCGIEQPDMNKAFQLIVYEIARSKHDNIELLSYAISLRDCHFSNFPLDRMLISAADKKNIRVLNWILTHGNYDLCQRLESPLFSALAWTFYDLIYYMFYALHDCLNSHRTVFDKLLQTGCGCSAIVLGGRNLLHYAVQQNNFYATKKLLELGVDLNLFDDHNKLPIHYSTSVEILDLLNTWTPTSKLNIHTRLGRNSILHLIVRAVFPADKCGFIKYVLDNGGNLNAVDGEGRSALFYVRDLETTKLLLTYKPNLDLLDKNGDSALIYLISSSNHDDHGIIDTLYQKDVLDRENSIFWHHLERKCNSSVGGIPFLIQTIRNCEQCARTLMKIPNLNVFVCDQYKSTLLHEAAKLKDVNLCQQFIEKGLSIDDRDKWNDTALLKYCENYVDNDNISYDSLSFMQFLKFNPDVNIKNCNGTSPIMIIACYEPNFDFGNIICELLLSGADLMDTDRCRKTVYSRLSSELQKILQFLT